MQNLGKPLQCLSLIGIPRLGAIKKIQPRTLQDQQNFQSIK